MDGNFLQGKIIPDISKSCVLAHDILPYCHANFFSFIKIF